MRPQILLVFGGESSEHDVSIASTHNVFAALDEHRYDVSLCYITREGKWLLVDSVDEPNGPELMPVLGEKRLVTADGAEVTPDVIFPVLHGKHGEDGDVQGLARLLHVSFVGPSLIGAAITMDKDVTKRLLRDAGIPVVDWLTWRVGEPRPQYENVRAKLGDTLFVKPANAGSSVGVGKVKNESGYEAALTQAAHHDELVIIERAVQAREIEIAVLGNAKVEVTEPGEIQPGQEFYSYADKYDPSSSAQVKIPAELDSETAAAIKHYAIKAYHATCGHGMARIDFFIDPDGEIYLNEINSIPGFTNISMYPKMWRYSGLTYPELLDRLILLARETV
jgi:D-alanine-D-alanine ligase